MNMRFGKIRLTLCMTALAITLSGCGESKPAAVEAGSFGDAAQSGAVQRDVVQTEAHAAGDGQSSAAPATAETAVTETRESAQPAATAAPAAPGKDSTAAPDSGSKGSASEKEEQQAEAVNNATTAPAAPAVSAAPPKAPQAAATATAPTTATARPSTPEKTAVSGTEKPAPTPKPEKTSSSKYPQIGWSEFFDNEEQTTPSDRFWDLSDERKTVQIKGFMGEVLSFDSNWFLLIPEPGAECPFDNGDETYWNKIMIVFVKDGSKLRYTSDPIQVTGRLDVGVKVDESGYKTMFRLYDARFETL